MPEKDGVAEIRARLVSERAKLLKSVAHLSREGLLQPYEGGWSIKDILAHVAMAEDVNARFARIMVEQDAPHQLTEFAREFPDFPGEFSLDKFNAWMAERWRARTLEQIVEALEQVRRETLAWVDTLTEKELARQGAHAVWGNQSVRGMLRILILHDRTHRAEIERRMLVDV